MKNECAGMYRVNDDTYPKIKVGRFVICKQSDNSVWIETEDGEGGEFSNTLFEKMIEEFFNTNF